jgi:hypothetical protein
MFMEPQAVQMKMLHVETTIGTELVPSDLVHPTPTVGELRDYCEGEVRVFHTGDVDCERHEGWYTRFSAPGYMDCTPWSGPYATSREAFHALAEDNNVCPECFEPCWDGEEPCEKDS